MGLFGSGGKNSGAIIGHEYSQEWENLRTGAAHEINCETEIRRSQTPCDKVAERAWATRVSLAKRVETGLLLGAPNERNLIGGRLDPRRTRRLSFAFMEVRSK